MTVPLPAPIAALFPTAISRGLDRALAARSHALLQTVRIRRDKPLAVTVNDTSLFLSSRDDFTGQTDQARRITAADMDHIVGAATAGSVYSVEDDLRRGYLTLPGGHRLGITGEGATHNGRLHTWRHISSVHIRVAHQRLGCADGVLSRLLDRSGLPQSTLLIGPPGSGKTTLLRDIARKLSQRFQVAIADERSELAGTYRGLPRLDVGDQTDVMDGVPKAIAMPMLVRSFAPDIVITDELGDEADVAAINDVLRTGVVIIASAHGNSANDLQRRGVFASLLARHAFQRIVVLSNRRGSGTVEHVGPAPSVPAKPAREVNGLTAASISEANHI